MVEINKEVVAIFLLAILAIWVVYPLVRGRESFDASGTEFVGLVGQQRYGLRGEPLRTSDIRKLYIRKDPNVMLSDSGGDMWISNNTPEIDGMKNCKKVQCPAYGYDNLDQCWQCGHPQVQQYKP